MGNITIKQVIVIKTIPMRYFNIFVFAPSLYNLVNILHSGCISIWADMFHVSDGHMLCPIGKCRARWSMEPTSNAFQQRCIKVSSVTSQTSPNNAQIYCLLKMSLHNVSFLNFSLSGPKFLSVAFSFSL